MKTEVRRISYKTLKYDPNSDWWSWKETCDICGKITQTFGGRLVLFAGKKEPDVYETDFCYECLKRLLDEQCTSNQTNIQ